MSDLQCPARFLVVGGADATTAGELRHERVAAVYDGQRDADGSAAGGATALAQALGLAVQALPRSLSVADALAREAAAMGELRDLADLHRGETVVVAAAGAPGTRADVSVDADGVTVVEVSPADGR